MAAEVIVPGNVVDAKRAVLLPLLDEVERETR
jgi:hypothetical protein